MPDWIQYSLKDDSGRSVELKRLTVADVMLLGSHRVNQIEHLEGLIADEPIKKQVAGLRDDVLSILLRLVIGTRNYIGFAGGVPDQPGQSPLAAFFSAEPVVAAFWPDWVDEVLAASMDETTLSEDEEGNS